MTTQVATKWQIYPGGFTDIADLDARWLTPEQCPPWRRHSKAWSERNDCVPPIARPFEDDDEGALRDRRRAESYVGSGMDEESRVNLALLLRRPILVRGVPGIGKSSLAYHIAWRLGLGRPFRWEIHSTSTLQDGLYSYDAVGHFHQGQASQIEDHVRLGPLGTVLAPTERPTCLLVDERDKASYDLPNDLLHAFEEEAFRIPELESKEKCVVRTLDGRPTPVRLGEIRCHHHPVVVITTNNERDFPPAFLRRCVEVLLQPPSVEQIHRIVRQWFGGDDGLSYLLNEMEGQPTDRILQALFLTKRHGAPLSEVKATLVDEKGQ